MIFSLVGFFFASLSICFLCLTALAHSSLNHDLFFLGRVEIFGILRSVISISFSVKYSIVLVSILGFRVFLQSSVKLDQSAFLKLNLLGGEIITGGAVLICMGKWPEPCVSSSVDQSSDVARSGLHIERSTEVVLSEAGMRYVGEVSFKRKVFVFVRRSSNILPFRSVESEVPHMGL